MSRESVPLQGGNVTEENMITWVIANALYLWFYLLLLGLLHDVLGRLAGFNNNHRSLMLSETRGHFSDRVQF